MKVISLFDGIATGRLALEQLGFQDIEYEAYEIEDFPIKVAKKNFPDIVEKGDVFKAEYRGGYDLLIGGSPCTLWSSARSKNATIKRETTPDGIGGRLFMEYVRALKECRPKYFLYENNNSMSKEVKAFITQQLGVEPIMINSALVSGQVRRRLYWTNIPNIGWPEDRGIKLIDVLDKRVSDKYYLSDKMIKYAMSSGTKNFYCKPEINLEKARPLTTAPNKRAGTTTYVSDDWVNGGSKDKIRRLTPIEYERLQTLPDNYTYIEGSRDSQRYKAVGNGWTLEIIKHILKNLKGKI